MPKVCKTLAGCVFLVVLSYYFAYFGGSENFSIGVITVSVITNFIFLLSFCYYDYDYKS